MKLLFPLLTVCFLNVSANGFSQKISFSGKNVPMKNFFSVIEDQTGYVVIYPSAVLAKARPVTIEVKNLPIKDFLDKLFQGQPIRYTIEGSSILLSYKPLAAQPAEQPEFPFLELPAPPVPITGIISDSLGNPLQGATIYLYRFKGTDEKGRNFSTTSNANGGFSLNVEEGDVLVFSYVGMASETITISKAMINRGKVSVTLRSDGSKLKDVEVTVNTGYQRIRPEQSTGAVSTITTKQYESRISTDFLSGLTNRLPGLMINNDISFNSNANGVQSSNNLFNIRGISTMTGNQSPLIVVDGYPTELTLDMINPNEIESVTILKDAAASTVYGVRASNGVIVIARKRASAGKARFSFRSTTGFTPKEDYSRYRWADDASALKIAYDRDRYKNSVNNATWAALNRTSTGSAWVPAYYVMAQEAANVITPYQAASKFNELSSYDNTDDYSNLFLRTALTQTYNLDMSGGTAGALYYITANYTGNRANQINNNNGRFQLTGRSTLRLSDRLSLDLTTDLQEQQSKAAPVPDINTIYPYEQLQDVNGSPLPIYSGSGINPFYNEIIQSKGLLDQLYYPLVDAEEVSDKNRISNNRVTANFTYNMGQGFNLQFGGIYEHSKTERKHYASERSSEARQYVNSYTDQDGTGSLVYNVPLGGFLQQQNFSTSGYTLRAQLNYNKVFGDHSLNGIIGGEIRNMIDQGSSAAYFGYNDETLLHQPVNHATLATDFQSPFLPGGSAIAYSSLFRQQYAENRYLSGYSNIVYSFRNTYSFTGSIRIDQSNLFGTNPKYKYKPLWSVGAAWNIHKENFMADLDWVKQLKMRVAYGFNGNVAKMSLPQVIAQSITNAYTSPLSTALSRYAFANSSLRWEQTQNFNAGIDFGIFKGINGSIDFYNKRSTDLLASAEIDPTIGPGPTWLNTASINNRGLEISLHADWISRNRFNWNTGFILGRNKGKVLKVYQNLNFYPGNLNGAGYLEGYPIGALFAYRWAGLNEIGYPQVMDEKGQVYSTEISNEINDIMTTPDYGVIRHMGTSLPVMNAGLSNRIDIGNFYVFCMINYYGGFKVFKPRPDPRRVRPLEGSGNYWKQAGDEKLTSVMSLAAFSGTYAGYAYNYADVDVVNGDYLTLGDLTVSYNLANTPMIRKAGFSVFELKLQASNIYTIGLNKFDYSMATRSYAKSYLTPTYTIALFTSF
ncbi:MAG: SusC/RagA family TonB-linked outer membrane protein [Candidatus Pseudobacter hemicellulosilyticus]|uniref:SusC/RagA family TonB-linked outer membrane protein n=1 Tax=Candidatus Pseudobacter hemicellulosilyticus TaxID=3121375 RepID=A0AAJ6BJ12_9BACT|nr:MAG: SusC/RagA family TonB-linked outer membrane protein [Pseudobacter sp.]